MSKIGRPKTPFEFCAYPALKEALEKTNYSQTELAQSLGVSQFTVSAWVRGDRDTTVRLLLALEDLTGMTFRELFGECEGHHGRV
jgi:transcriptional regulator with XRE-family HTH domain